MDVMKQAPRSVFAQLSLRANRRFHDRKNVLYSIAGSPLYVGEKLAQILQPPAPSFSHLIHRASRTESGDPRPDVSVCSAKMQQVVPDLPELAPFSQR